VVTDGKGETRDFSMPNDKLDDILGLAVDAAGARLYAVSTNGFEESAKKERRNAVVGYDLRRGHLLDRFAAPEALQLNDLGDCAGWHALRDRFRRRYPFSQEAGGKNTHPLR
jgi:hypothetical protein